MTKKNANEQEIGNSELLPLEVLTPVEMGNADRMTIEGGVPGYRLMLAAGQAVADHALKLGGERILVLAGPGNNGGDGLVAARLLMDAGRPVSVAMLGGPEKLSGDAAQACADFSGKILPFGPDGADVVDVDVDLIVDALFGAGLARGLAGGLGRLADRVNASSARVLAVDLPSGVDGATGNIAGRAIIADLTVTFFRLKPGHLLYPGRANCGQTRLEQIGISADVLAEIDSGISLNTADLWRRDLPRPDHTTHKYSRGHTLVVSGPRLNTGASRLAANAALRIGSGLVTVAAGGEAANIHAAHLTAVMIREMKTPRDLSALLSDARFSAVAIGPAAGLGESTRENVLACLESGAAVVLDADALTIFAEHPDELFEQIGKRDAPVVLTPHSGEYSRLFADPADDRLSALRDAAARSGAIVVLKGANTIVAGPGGEISIAVNAPPWLATAGSGDVLAGMVAGLLAQGMPAFQAASAAVWLHGEAATAFGPGLTADDLPGRIPDVLGKVNCLIENAENLTN